MHNKKMFDIENEDQGDAGKHPQQAYCHSIANIPIETTKTLHNFAQAFTISEKLVFLILNSVNFGIDRAVQKKSK